MPRCHRPLKHEMFSSNIKTLDSQSQSMQRPNKVYFDIILRCLGLRRMAQTQLIWLAFLFAKTWGMLILSYVVLSFNLHAFCTLLWSRYLKMMFLSDSIFICTAELLLKLPNITSYREHADFGKCFSRIELEANAFLRSWM